MNAFSINVTSNDTDEISEDMKVKFVNRNKNSSKCVAKQVGTLETPSLVPEIFSKTKYAKSYKSKAKGNSNKKLLSPLAFGQISATELSNNYMKKRSSAKICLNDQSKVQGSLLFKFDNEGQFEKILEDCFKKGVDFEEAMTILKTENLMEELSVEGENKNKTGNIHVKSEYYEDFNLDNYSPGSGLDCCSNNLTGNLKQSSINNGSDTCKIYSKNTANTNNSNEINCISSNKCSSSDITDNLNNSDSQSPTPDNFKLKYLNNLDNNYDEFSEMKMSKKDKPYELAINDTKVFSPQAVKDYMQNNNTDLYKEQFNQENNMTQDLIDQISNIKEVDKGNNNNDFNSDVSD